MNQNKIRILILILALLFLTLPAVSAHIDIIDVGHYNAARWDDIGGMCGYVDYQNVANHTIGGTILVFVDGEIAAGKMIKYENTVCCGLPVQPYQDTRIPSHRGRR